MSQPEPTPRMIELQREQMMIRQLLHGKLSEHTRPHMEELLRIVDDAIERERQKMTSKVQGAS